MSEATPPPEPPAGAGPTDPTAPPASGPWAPPDPLPAPQPWVPPTPWSPEPWSPAPWPPPGPADAPGVTGMPGVTDRPGSTGTPGATGQPGGTGTPGMPGRPDTPGTLGPGGHPGRPDTLRPAAPPAAHPWPGYGVPAWPPAGYPPPYAYPGAPQTRTSGGQIAAIVAAVATVLVLIFCGCVGVGLVGGLYGDPGTPEEPYGQPVEGDTDGPVGADPARSPAATPSGGPGELTVVYEVTGGALVDVQFYDANGDFYQFDGVRSPWRMMFTANDRHQVQIIASPAGPAGGTVTCRITIDGKVVSRDSGGYGAVCFGW